MEEVERNPYDIQEPEEEKRSRFSGVDLGEGLSIFLVAVIAVVVGGTIVYVYLNNSGNNISQSNALTGLLSSKNATFGGLQVLLEQKVDSSPQFNISYLGSETLTTRSNKSNSTEELPIAINYLDYYNSSRTTITAIDTPVMGNVSLVEVLFANRTAYLCGASLTSSKYNCQSSNDSLSSVGNAYSTIGEIPVTTAISNGDFLIRYLGNMKYNGQPCAMVMMNTSSPERISSENVSVRIASCLSLQYYLPLNISISENAVSSNSLSPNKNTTTVYIRLNETAINQRVTLSQATKLPGPVSNAIFLQNVSSTRNQSGSSAPVALRCLPNFGYACQNAKIRNGILGFEFSQTSNNKYYNTGYACTANNYTGTLTVPLSGDFEFPSTSGILGPYKKSNTTAVLNAQSTYVNLLQCYGPNGYPLYSSSINGSIFFNYTKQAGAPGPTNPWVTIDVASISPSYLNLTVT